MHIVRWLLRSPLALIWTLAIIAILLNWIVMGIYGGHEESDAKAAVHSASTEAGKGTEHGKKMAEHGKTAENHQAMVGMGGMSGMSGMAGMSGMSGMAAAQQAGNIPPPAPPVSNNDEVLIAAREAYWSNELDTSIEFYKKIIEKQPDSLQYKGELANVYWKKGSTKEAADLFADIAPKLAAVGRNAEAFNMKLYIYMVDPAMAKRLDATIGNNK